MVIDCHLLRQLCFVVVLTEVLVRRDVTREPKLLDQLIRTTSQKLVERVEVVVSGLLPNHSGLLQQVVVDVSTHRITLLE